MVVAFQNLPDSAPVYIYPCNRSFTSEEICEIAAHLTHFLETWTAQNPPLQAGFEIKYHRFVIIALNASHTRASGAAIEALVQCVQQLEARYGVVLLDRMNVSFKQGPYIAYKSLKDFKKMVKTKAVSKNTIVFNNLVATKLEYLEYWEVPVYESWHARFL